MPFLRSRDYPVYIQAQQLAQITKDTSGAMSNLEVRISAENDAIEEASEYLQQKYDVTYIFTDTLTYDPADTYNGNDRIELEAPVWVAGPFTIGDLVLFTDNKIYICILNTTANQAPSDATYWKSIGWNLQLFYLKYPFPLFSLNDGCYKVGDKVFWKGFIYQCLIPSIRLSQTERIQYDDTTEYPYPNAFPDDPTMGIQQWGTGVAYSVTGVGPTDTAAPWSGATHYDFGQTSLSGGIIWQSLIPGIGTNFDILPGSDIVSWQPIAWIKGDNRNKSLVTNIIHITLWNLHSNIAPQNVPMLREKNHIRAIKWLEDVKKGNKALDGLTMQVLQPLQGGRILIASRPAQNNRW